MKIYKEYSIRTLILRLLEEFKYPQTKTIHNLKSSFDKSLIVYKNKGKDKINFIYDLNYESATFDFAYASLLVDNICKTKNTSFNCIIIKRKRKNIKNFYPFNIEQINNRIFDMLVPISKSFKNMNSIFVLESKMEIYKYELNKNVFSFNYSNKISRFNYKYLFNKIISPSQYEGINSDISINKKVKNIIENQKLNIKKTVTISLRMQKYDKFRNSSLNFWSKISKELIKLKFNVIIIPDSDNFPLNSLKKHFKNIPILDIFSYNMFFKISLYEMSFLNLFPHGGLPAVSQLNKKSKSITFLNTSHNGQYNNKEYFKSIGQNINEQYGFLNQNNHLIVWNCRNSKQATEVVKDFIKKLNK